MNKDHAEKIARKLNAEIVTNKGPHDLAIIRHDDGHILVTFGIRRGSRKSLGHDHIPKDLHFSPHKCLGLAQCPVSREDWLGRLREIGLLA